MQYAGFQSQWYKGDYKKANMEMKTVDTLELSPLLWGLDIHKCLSIHT